MLWKKAVAALMNAADAVPADTAAIADHIARFSLGGIEKARTAR